MIDIGNLIMRSPTMATTSKSTPSKKKSASYDGFTDDERAAMKERAKELKSKRAKKDPEADLLEKVAEMPDEDRVIAERIHAIVKESAPELEPKTWYGMPAYAQDGKVVCFFQSAAKFKSRYATFGFNDAANLDDGSMWATSFAITDLTPDTEDQIRALVQKSIS
jgi:uncharacterized protein YdhG (YjbR/CyaY superfamily)